VPDKADEHANGNPRISTTIIQEKGPDATREIASNEPRGEGKESTKREKRKTYLQRNGQRIDCEWTRQADKRNNSTSHTLSSQQDKLRLININC